MKDRWKPVLLATALMIGYAAPILYVEYKIHQENQALATRNFNEVSTAIERVSRDLDNINHRFDKNLTPSPSKTLVVVYTATPTVQPEGK